MGWGFQLRALHLESSSTAWAIPSVHFVLVILGSHELFSRTDLKTKSSWSQPPTKLGLQVWVTSAWQKKNFNRNHLYNLRSHFFHFLKHCLVADWIVVFITQPNWINTLDQARLGIQKSTDNSLCTWQTPSPWSTSIIIIEIWGCCIYTNHFPFFIWIWRFIPVLKATEFMQSLF
jgi:hypothetical protein